jgi:hypothetical protein
MSGVTMVLSHVQYVLAIMVLETQAVNCPEYLQHDNKHYDEADMSAVPLINTLSHDNLITTATVA